MTRSQPGRCAVRLGAVLALVAAGASAAAAPRVVVMAEERDGALARRLRAEFVALSFEVTVAPVRGFSASELQQAAQAADAVAAVYVGPSSRGLEVWVADRLTGKVVLSEVLEPPGTSVTLESLVATRAVELLRASLLELERRPPDSAGAAVTALLDQPRARGSWLELGVGGVLTSAQGMAATGQVGVDVRLVASEHFAVELSGALPVVSAQVRAGEGAARLAPWLVSLGGAAGWPRLTEHFGASLLLGAWLVVLHYQGEALPGYQGLSGELVTEAPFLGGEVLVRAWSRFALRLRATAAYALAPLVIRFDQRPVATLGQLWGAVSLTGVVSL